ncbi:MAG TPA: T9SS type A sorting domain-containing protein [Chitinophagales bacterium]|nr:T9SS type A sorting domain-containing protein [Chitinophagales bacterium]
MRNLLLFLSFLTSTSLLFAQNNLKIEANIDSIKRKVQFDAIGVNAERMYYRILDENGNVPEEITEDMLEAEDLVYRWPGGATSNFYHYFGGTSKGYGLSRQEINAISHPMSCNLPNNGTDECMTFEKYAKTNYIHNLLEFADRYYDRYKKKKRVVWLPNIFTFYIHNKSEISLLDGATTIEEAEDMMKNGVITADFYKRLKDVIDVYDILRSHPSIELEGIEYGNEFYFHEPATGLKYNVVNNNLLWLTNQKKYKKTFGEHITLYRSIVQFYNSALFDRGPKIPTAVPVGIISFLGNQANMNRLWNEGIRDSILPMVDGVIHHFYFKIDNGPRITPSTAEDPEMADTLIKIKQLADDFIHDRIPRVDEEYEKFFKLTETGKKMWMTEFNTDNGYFDGYLAEWQNTFFHCFFQFEAFLSFIDNKMNSDVMKFAFPHLWVSYANDYNYGAYSAEVNLDGTYNKIKRTTYNAYSILGELAKHNLYKLNDSISNTNELARRDLLIRTYFEPSEDSTAQEVGRLFVVFSNKSGEVLQFNPSTDLSILSQSIDQLSLSNIYAEYLSAEHIYSSNGFTMLDTFDIKTENINITRINDISATDNITLPGYSIGFISIPVLDDEKIITSSFDQLVKNIELYPNPTKSSLQITFKDRQLLDAKFHWKVIDVIGKEQAININNQTSSTLQLDVSNLAKGMYHFVINDSKGQVSKSFVVQ